MINVYNVSKMTRINVLFANLKMKTDLRMLMKTVIVQLDTTKTKLINYVKNVTINYVENVIRMDNVLNA